MFGIIIFVFIWAISGFLAYGITLGYFQREYPSIANECIESDQNAATMFALFGMMGLIVSFICSNFAKHGLLYDVRNR